jgi:crotonobetainyl-CoA:carnitine CoA-transferase CaiB-like acyl-CoA transferase
MPAKECAARLQAARVPATVVNTCADLLADSDLQAREFFQQTGPAELRVPGLPAVARPSKRDAPRATAPGGTRARTRVLDLSHVLAGPLGTAWLGAMGFDVVKVEDPARLDSYRRRGPFCAGINDPERSAYFSAVNFSKRGISLGYEAPDGGSALSKLLRDADFIVENLSATRAARVLPAAARAESSACLISSSGFGRVASERASWRAYGHNIHAHGGLVHLSSDRDGNPTDLGTAWADPLTAIWIALTVTAQSLLPADQGFDVDLSMSEVVAFQFPDLLAAQQTSSKDVQEEESRLPGYVPHGIFPTSDGWLAVGVRTDEEWARLVEALGCPPTLTAAGYRGASGRTARQAELEADLEAVLRATDHATAVTRLQSAGLSCTGVLRAEDLITDPHLEHRGLFRPVRHPVCGDRRLAGLPWKVADGPAYPITPPPTIGQHSEDLDDPWR